MVNKKLLENIFSLATIKGLQYILSFITFPYLTHVLQVERFGAVVFAQSILQYFTLFTDYGFNLVGPREIARHDSVAERGKVFSNIFFAKVSLLLIATLAGAVLLQFFSRRYAVDTSLYLVCYLNVIGFVIFPVWFFQGIQQMRYITMVDVIGRLISVIGIFRLVKAPEDYLLAAFFQSAVPLVSGCFAWGILAIRYRETLCLPSCQEMKLALKAGWEIFVSSVAINLYTASSVVFLGLLTNNTMVGYYSGAKKIIDNITQLFSPVMQGIYPYVSKKVAVSQEEAVAFLRKVTRFMGLGNLAISIILLVFADFFVTLLLGPAYHHSVILLRIMAFLPLLIGLSQVFGVQVMMNFGMQKEFSRILILASILNLTIICPLIFFVQATGVAAAVTITEFFVTAAMYRTVKRNGIDLIQ